MLRAKQITTLSNSARSIFLGRTRCGTGEGSSCSCSEDERSIPRKQLPRSDTSSVVQKAPTLVSNTSAKVRGLVSVDNARPPHKAENLPQAVSTGPILRPEKSGIVSYAADVDASESSLPRVPDKFFRAGIAAVNFLNDLVNDKIPLSDGSGSVIPSFQNYAVDPSRPVSNVKPTTLKAVRKESSKTVHSRPSIGNSHSSSHYNTRDNREDGKAGKSDPEGLRGLSDTGIGNPADRPKAAFPDAHKRRVNARRQQVKAHSNNFFHSSPAHVSDVGISECFSGSVKDAGVLNEIVSKPRHYTNSFNMVDHVSRTLMRMKWGPQAKAALRSLGCSIDAYQANQILKNLHDHGVALGFFDWLKEHPGYKHDGHTYTTMIGILGRSRQFGAINKLLDQMVMEGCHPNVVTYNRLIHSYGRANYLKEAVSVFKQMQEVGIEPDRVTYCTLIDIHAKAGFLDIAMDMYRRMQAVGLSPDTFTYSVMINCLGKAGYLADAHRLFTEMVYQGCVPNVVTYNIMIALHAKARNYETALELYWDMQNSGYKPDKVTYSTVMEALGHCGHPEEAEAVYFEMAQKNWVPDEPVYGLLVDMWGKVGQVEKASGWYRAMLDAGLRPNVPTCNSLLGAFLKVHRLSDAYDVLQSMFQLGLSPSLQTYTLLLSCCTEAQSSFEMSFCCRLMATTGHPAHMFLQSLPDSGPDGQNVRDHVGRFLDLLHSEDRESKRGLVDAVVDFLHKSGLKEQAGSVWEVAAEKNLYPDAVREKTSCYWHINLHVMSEGTAITALSRTLAWFRRQMLVSGVSPTRIDIITGWGRRSRVTGSSLVKQSVQELLNIFSFPFFVENGNTGCFVGYGEPLNRWLHQSCVERMHLL
ncbi:hypothetical protein SAY86_005133 [Trapa natans]|uniref:Smr domain-containing protein n=1 Tax=Trapa natans TaxID=22666 RepID=A0AAN7L0H9_TRANT|nr:hypothetical protein SAY86_005133 [Trapa natans]